MSGIREFRREDIPRVAELWLKVFRRHSGPPSEALQAYFRDIFFENPWRDAGLPSLLHEDGQRRVVGFLGVIPRRMEFRGRGIRVAVATQLMVDEAISPAYAAARLIRRFFAGSQDLSLSDGANDAGEKLWRACGGDAAALYSLNWLRVLRPTQHFRLRLKERGHWLAAPLWPLGSAVDACVERSGLGAYWLPDREGLSGAANDSDPSADKLLWCMQQLDGRRSLRPRYEADSLRWLMKRAADKQNHGELRKGVVRLANGRIAGWYLYYLRPGHVGQVLQYGAAPEHFGLVMNHLFHRAWTEGAVAMAGSVEPRFARELASQRCRLALPGYGVLMQSPDADILNAIHRGDAFLTRLEGEWWARFSDREWSLPDAAPSTDAQGLGALRQAPA